MAERRMFAKTIVLSDAFLDMPVSAQTLYFHLGMVAYNKGIVVGARKLTEAIGAHQSDLDLLVSRKYLISLDDGTYQITHWYENNGIGETAKKRNAYNYRKWRQAVIDRDCICAKCGSADHLEAHHIKPFSQFPDLRLDIDNGIALCKSCHRKLHGLEKKQNGEETDV